MYWLQFMVTLWLLALMVFHANPLNNPLKPESRLNPYHHENVLIRKVLEEKLAMEGDDNDIVVEWPDIAPYVAATCVTAFCAVLQYIIGAAF